MTIRKATMHDFDEICLIYADAREFMRESGNPNQWKTTHPPVSVIERDIQTGFSHVLAGNEEIAAVFFYSTGGEPTYGKIDGAWLDDRPYGVVHRIARSSCASGAGAGTACLDWCYAQCGNLRIDTHRDNAPMRKLLDKLGFTYCGKIWLENGEERLAYQKN